MNLSQWVVASAKRNIPVNRSIVPYRDDVEKLRLMAENNIHDISIYLVNELMNAEVLLRQNEEPEGFDEGHNFVKAKVIACFADEDGNIIGNANI